jgi:hypothetical protein
MMSLSNEEQKGGVLRRRRKWDLAVDSKPGFVRCVVSDRIADDDEDGVLELEIFFLLMSLPVVVGEEKSEVFRPFQHFDVAKESIARRYSYV